MKTTTPTCMVYLWNYDDGTIVNPVQSEKNLWEKSTWFYRSNMKRIERCMVLYFDPKTYAMEIYQFYHDGRKNDGE
jgi:hypothetical protein